MLTFIETFIFNIRMREAIVSRDILTLETENTDIWLFQLLQMITKKAIQWIYKKHTFKRQMQMLQKIFKAKPCSTRERQSRWVYAMSICQSDYRLLKKNIAINKLILKFLLAYFSLFSLSFSLFLFFFLSLFFLFRFFLSIWLYLEKNYMSVLSLGQ